MISQNPLIFITFSIALQEKLQYFTPLMLPNVFTDWSLISTHKSMERILPQEERSGVRKAGKVSRDLVSELIARLLKIS